MPAVGGPQTDRLRADAICWIVDACACKIADQYLLNKLNNLNALLQILSTLRLNNIQFYNSAEQHVEKQLSFCVTGKFCSFRNSIDTIN